jgi:amino acid transporter
MRSAQLGETLLPKRLALPVFCSDPISSVAYATEQILLVLGLGGSALLSLASPIAAVVAVLLVTVVLSYRQTCYAYPSGGGAYIVSKENLGDTAALTAASALLVDYVMTVVVSVVSGVIAITSAIPALQHDAVRLSVAGIVVLALANLRGVKESGTLFAIPTYSFIAMVGALFTYALVRVAGGGLPQASSAHEHLSVTAHVGGFFTVLLALKAFASGSTALTGVEAISNGVPSFQKPKSRNAANTLSIMGVLAVSMFVGVTVLAVAMHARALPSGNPSVISQLAGGVFGSGSPLFYLFQASTAAILILAANTAFNGFPGLSSILARDGYLPNQLANRGDRLVYSNGIILLALASVGLVIAFKANLDQLIQLYIIGVFTSFTLSQSGMVRHWNNLIERSPGQPHRSIRRSQTINLVGAIITALVLVIVVYSKFLNGAWLAMTAMIVIFVVMRIIKSHYLKVSRELEIPKDHLMALPSRNHGIVLVSKLHLPTMRALAYARSTRPSDLVALTVQVDEKTTSALQDEWFRRGITVPLIVVGSPYRETTKPIVDYVRQLRRRSARDVVTVFIPQYVVVHWWEHVLHNQTALRLKGRLLFLPGVMVTSVPWQLESSDVRTVSYDGAGLKRTPPRLARPDPAVYRPPSGGDNDPTNTLRPPEK